jgi:ferric-dicitrate binding protein FerR (iron transport regulator)
MKSEKEVKVTEELLVKYLAGEATPEEAITINDWLETEENKIHFGELQSIWNGVRPSKDTLTRDKAEAWKRIEATLGGVKRRQVPGVFHNRTFAIAATILLAAVAALLYFRRGPSSELIGVTTTDSTRYLTLDDNSRITMYNNTGVLVPKEFKGDVREITLVKGEAYFSVAKNEEKPFIVHAGFANIRVLGTEFNVIVKDGEVVVGVNEGKVLFYTTNDSVFIEKGMAVAMKPAKAAEPVSMSSNAWAYATRKLVFKDTPMEDVIAVVEKTYGRTFRVNNDKVKNCKLTATFDGESIENVVFLITQTLDLKLQKNGEVFILDGEGCP